MKVNFNRIIIPGNRDWMVTLLTNMLQCKICMNILNDPYDCLCCNQTFCRKCIVNYINANNHCPFAKYFQETKPKKDQLTSPSNKIKPTTSNITKLISSLKFSCSFSSKGCQKQLNLEEITDHEKSCKYRIEKKPPKNTSSNSKEKFKFQDSSMSFRKVDVSQLDKIENANNLAISNDASFFSTNHNAKIDLIYEMISKLSNSQRDHKRNNSKEKESLKKINEKLQKPTKNLTNKIDLSNDSFEKESTPKFNKSAKKLEPSELSLAPSQKNQVEKLASEVRRLNLKLTNMEQILQATISIKNQACSFSSAQPTVNMDDFYGSAVSTKCSAFENPGSVPSSLRNSNKGPIPPVGTHTPTNSAFDIRKKFSQQVFKSNSGMKQNKTYTNFKNAKINASNAAIKCEDKQKERELQAQKDKDEIKSKIDEIKNCFDENCISKLKEYFFEITLDNTNLFSQKIDEVIDAVKDIKEAMTAAKGKSEEPPKDVV